MKLRRREFLKGIAGGAALTAVGQSVDAREKERLDGALGILYDATLCVGCQACMVACKQANNMPFEHAGQENLYDNPQDLSSKSLNIIKKYSNGTGKVKDHKKDGYSFVQRHCMHCVDPGCVSACPVGAMHKDETNGIVSYDEKRCIGCRYCQIACPYNIPKFEWESAFPKIVKCQLCSHLIAKGGISACCGACPTGASLFGPVPELMKEARRRLQMTPGAYYPFPVSQIDSASMQEHKAAQYYQKIYGENDAGGTQMLLLAGVPFDQLGLPELPDKSYASIAEGIQHTLYKGMLLPIALLAGLAFLVKKNGGNDHE